MREEAVCFGDRDALVGVVTSPDGLPPGSTAVILLNAGLIHRVGPKRLYVRMARRIASLGFCVLRFDLSGIGDSAHRRDDLPEAESVRRDVRAAMEFLARDKAVSQYVLAGICAGAVISFILACEVPDVVGVELIDPTDFGASAILGVSSSAETEAHRYFRSVSSRPLTLGRFARLLTGRSDYSRAVGALTTRLLGVVRGRKTITSAGDYVTSRIRTLVDRGVRLLVVYTEYGESLDFVRAALGSERELPGLTGPVSMTVVAGADHDFTLPSAQEELLGVVEAWTARFLVREQTPPSGPSRGSFASEPSGREL